VQVQVTELVKSYRFDRSDLAAVASSLEVDELRPLFADRVKAFTIEEKEVLYALSPHSIFIDDAIQQYGSAKSFRGAERLFERMIRPFISIFRSANVNAVLDLARNNSQIYSATETPVQMTQLFEQTSDLLAETDEHWRTFLNDATTKYDSDGEYYADLRSRMVNAGLLSAIDSSCGGH
jgi:hypothetical protein